MVESIDCYLDNRGLIPDGLMISVEKVALLCQPFVSGDTRCTHISGSGSDKMAKLDYSAKSV
jgi:hypothetical protein